MAHFEEQADQPYDWNQGGVYVIEREDPVDGGLEGVSNRQGRELTQRTRNLHGRLAVAEGEIDGLQSDLPIAAEAAKRSAMEHTDQTAAAVRDELAVGDQAALRSAKEYADRIVAALVDNSPELLNTLEELAGALGNDPNFATTVMQAIGERATMGEVNTALAGKFDRAGGELTGDVVVLADDVLGGRWIKQRITGSDTVGLHLNRSVDTGKYTQLDIYTRGSDGFQRRATIDERGLLVGGHLVYHTGNLPAVLDAIEIGGVNLVSERNWLDNGSFYTQQIAVTPGKSYMHSGNCGIAGWKTPSRQFVYGNPIVVPAGVSSLVVHVGRDVAIGSVRVMIEQATKPSAYQPHFSDLVPKIIRGSVGADGIKAPGSNFNSYKSGEVIYVDHNFGNTQFMAVATVYGTNPSHRDNVATVIYKDNTKVGFQVTAGPDATVEWAPFDFIIMPY